MKWRVALLCLIHCCSLSAALYIESESGILNNSRNTIFSSSLLKADYFSAGYFISNQERILLAHTQGQGRYFSFYAGTLYQTISQGFYISNRAYLPNFTSYGDKMPIGMSQTTKFKSLSYSTHLYSRENFNVEKTLSVTENSQMHILSYDIIATEKKQLSFYGGIYFDSIANNFDNLFSGINYTSTLSSLSVKTLITKNLDSSMTFSYQVFSYDIHLLLFRNSKNNNRRQLSSQIYQEYQQAGNFYIFNQDNKASVLYGDKDYRVKAQYRLGPMLLYSRIDKKRRFLGIAYLPNKKGLQPYAAFYQSLSEKGYLVSLGVRVVNQFQTAVIYSAPLSSVLHSADPMFWQNWQTGNYKTQSLFYKERFYGLMLKIKNQSLNISALLLRFQEKDSFQVGLSFKRFL